MMSWGDLNLLAIPEPWLPAQGPPVVHELHEQIQKKRMLVTTFYQIPKVAIVPGTLPLR